METVIKSFKRFDVSTPNKFKTVKRMIITEAIIFLFISPPNIGKAAPKAVAKPTDMVAQAIMITTHFNTPTSKPQKSPRACFAYK